MAGMVTGMQRHGEGAQGCRGGTVMHKEALAKHLGVDVEDLEELSYSRYGLRVFGYEKEEYAVGTDEEADKAAKEYIEDSLWAFRTEFIIDHTALPYEAVEILKTFQEKKCEGANETIRALIKDIDKFVEDAIGADGRAHFLNTYDGDENEEVLDEETYYIYKM